MSSVVPSTVIVTIYSIYIVLGRNYKNTDAEQSNHQGRSKTRIFSFPPHFSPPSDVTGGKWTKLLQITPQHAKVARTVCPYTFLLPSHHFTYEINSDPSSAMVKFRCIFVNVKGKWNRNFFF